MEKDQQKALKLYQQVRHPTKMQPEARPWIADCPITSHLSPCALDMASTHFYQQLIGIIRSCLTMELQNPIVSYCSVIKKNILKRSFVLPEPLGIGSLKLRID